MPFKKGHSGNPGGRPKDELGIKELARQHAPAAISTLKSIMSNEEAPPNARVSAATAMLDRGYGKPDQKNELSGNLTVERIERVIIEDSQDRDGKGIPATPGTSAV